MGSAKHLHTEVRSDLNIQEQETEEQPFLLETNFYKKCRLLHVMEVLFHFWEELRKNGRLFRFFSFSVVV